MPWSRRERLGGLSRSSKQIPLLAVLLMSEPERTLADRYVMTKRLGDGTFGEVLLARKIDTGDKVAIKRSVLFPIDKCPHVKELEASPTDFYARTQSH